MTNEERARELWLDMDWQSPKASLPDILEAFAEQREAGRVEGIAEGRAQAFEEAADIARGLRIASHTAFGLPGDVWLEQRGKRTASGLIESRIRARSKAGESP